MTDTLFKLKSGTISTMERKVNGVPIVPLDAGTVYFAVDTTTHIGKILYDVSDGNGGIDRIVMNTHAEYADTAGSTDHATSASQADALATQRSIDGILFNGSNNVIHYGKCTTAADTASKQVACSGYNLITGARITVTFANTNTASNVSLNVQNTGAKAIYYRGAAISPSVLVENRTYEFVYDGTYYVLIGDIDTNTVYELASKTSDGLMSAADKDKLDGIEVGAKAGTVTSITAGVGLAGGTFSTSGTIKAKLLSESNLINAATAATEVANRVYPVAVDLVGNLAVNVPWENTTYEEATKTTSGLMSDEDKTKLDGIESGAQKNSITGVKGDSESSYRTGNVNITKANIGLSNVENKSSATIRSELTAADVNTALGYTAASDALATSTTAGLMSANDKAKVDAGLSIAGNSLALGSTLSADDLRTSLGLSNAMHYIGIATVAITDDSTTNPTITGYDFVNNKKPGDVVIDKDSSREYVWASYGKWEQLGPDGSYALVDHRHANADTSTDGFMSADDKSKLNGIASGAQVNVIESVKLNGTALTVTNKAVNIPVMGGATASAAGTVGVVPAPEMGTQSAYYLRADGSWQIPPNTEYNNASGTVSGLMSSNDKSKLDGMTVATLTGTSPITVTNSGMAYTVTHDVVGPSTSNTSKGDTTNQTPSWGGTFKVTSGTVDKFGHTTAFEEHTVTIPSTTADGTHDGLMSAGDKSKLNGIAAGAQTGTVLRVTAGTGLNTSDDQADSATKGSITTTGTLYLTTSGVTAGSYGQSADYTEVNDGTFKIPYITVDKYGRITSVVDKTITAKNENNLVTNTLANTTKFYVTGTGSASTNTGTQYFDNGVYVTTTEGQINAKTYKVNEAVTLQYNSTTQSLDFIFA